MDTTIEIMGQNLMAYLAKICIYPIKSLDGVEIKQAELLAGGSLAGDREFAIVNDRGKFVNGKRTDLVHKLRAKFDLVTRTVILNIKEQNRSEQFHLDRDRSSLATWLSEYFGYSVSLEQNLTMGFPDDTASPGPTIISNATLKAVNSWFPELSLEEIRQRFRTNLELEAVPAFWEDRLFSEANRSFSFQIGDIAFLGINPCQRCIVPTRNSQTGDRDLNFQNIFVAKRQDTLPTWTDPSRFNHFYRLAVNTKIPISEAGKTLKIGDVVKIGNSKD